GSRSVGATSRPVAETDRFDELTVMNNPHCTDPGVTHPPACPVTCLANSSSRLSWGGVPLRDDVLMALRPRQRATSFLACSVLALLGFHAAFLLFAMGLSLLIPLMVALAFAVAAGGYAWPPIANREAWFKSA